MAAQQTPQSNSQWQDGTVTVLIRQLPRQFTQQMFLQELSYRGFFGTYDFLHIPLDLKKGTNLGYGLVNFLEQRHALSFLKVFDGIYLDMQMKHKGKPIRIHSASVQGLDANCKHFVQTKVGQKQDPHCSPLVFPGGSSAEAPDEVKLELPVQQEASQLIGLAGQGLPPMPRGDAPGREATISLAQFCGQDPQLARRTSWAHEVQQVQQVQQQRRTSWTGAPPAEPLSPLPAVQQPLVAQSGHGGAQLHNFATSLQCGIVPPVAQPLSPKLAAGVVRSYAGVAPAAPMLPAQSTPVLGTLATRPVTQDISSTVRNLEEEKARLLNELAMVQEGQRRAMNDYMSAASVIRPQPSPSLANPPNMQGFMAYA